MTVIIVHIWHHFSAILTNPACHHEEGNDVKGGSYDHLQNEEEFVKAASCFIVLSCVFVVEHLTEFDSTNEVENQSWEEDKQVDLCTIYAKAS